MVETSTLVDQPGCSTEYTKLQILHLHYVVLRSVVLGLEHKVLVSFTSLTIRNGSSANSWSKSNVENHDKLTLRRHTLKQMIINVFAVGFVNTQDPATALSMKRLSEARLSECVHQSHSRTVHLTYVAFHCLARPSYEGFDMPARTVGLSSKLE